MIMKKFKIGNIPAVLWGPEADRLIIAVHGSLSSKTDDCINVLAREAVSCGYQVLSFDLPSHGERSGEEAPCMPQNSTRDLHTVMEYARSLYSNISLFACSMGAYFSLLAYADEDIEKALFLSPVVDMNRVIANIMSFCNVSEDDLKEAKIIETPMETLYWDYYSYVKAHPVSMWPHPTYILRGEFDNISETEYVRAFADRFGCHITQQPAGEHWFHTKEQLDFLRNWLKEVL